MRYIHSYTLYRNTVCQVLVNTVVLNSFGEFNHQLHVNCSNLTASVQKRGKLLTINKSWLINYIWAERGKLCPFFFFFFAKRSI